MISFWNSLILRNQFKQIDHKYLVRGHTYLPNDRDFSHIEKLKSSSHVFIPEQWEDVIASARKKDPYNVQRMRADEFLDFGALEKEYTRRKKDSSKKPVLISKVAWMNFGQAVTTKDGQELIEEHPNEVWLRGSYDESEEWLKVSLLKGRKRTQPNVDFALPKMYPSGHAVNPKKIGDLEKMIPFLPLEYRQFYVDLQSHPTCNSSTDQEYGE